VGRPTGATVVYDDGGSRYFDDVEAAQRQAEVGRVEFHYAYGPGALPATSGERFDMWRYRDLLPLEAGPITYPLSVGGTPLSAPPVLRQAAGVTHLWLKDETRSPTGSNKDRATALVLQHAMNAGLATVSCSSTGNVAVSLAVGAAAAGRRAVIFVPAGVAESKLLLMRAAGATVLKVIEGYPAAVRLSRQAAAAFGWYDRNTGFNPLTLEAKKTVAFEVWEQLNCEVPDAILVPVGDGTTLSGVAKGFRELVACGVSGRMPRIIGVQAEGCQPVKRAWETGTPMKAVEPATIADGIAVGAPISGAMALRDVRQSGGGFVAVSDAEILAAVQTLATKAGVLAEPAGAAAFAGLRRSLEDHLVDQGERVVVLATGSALKTPQILRPLSAALAVHADLAEVRKALCGGEGLNIVPPHS
jgi:threonine synthase